MFQPGKGVIPCVFRPFRPWSRVLVG